MDINGYNAKSWKPPIIKLMDINGNPPFLQKKKGAPCGSRHCHAALGGLPEPGAFRALAQGFIQGMASMVSGGNMGKTNGFWGASDVIFLLEQLQKMIHWLAKGELKNMWSDDPLDILGYPLVNIQKAIENGDL